LGVIILPPVNPNSACVSRVGIRIPVKYMVAISALKVKGKMSARSY